MSVFSDFFSLKRRESCTPNFATKPSADKRYRFRRRSLSAKYQTFFSNFSQDWKAAINTDGDAGQKPQELVGSARPPISDAKPAPASMVSSVTTIKPQESPPQGSHKTVEDPEMPEKTRPRRRPKTPVRSIGQLEAHAEEQRPLSLVEVLAEGPPQSIDDGPITLAEALAEGLRSGRKSPATPPSPMTPRSLRKVGGHQNLRRTSLDSDVGPTSPNLSDSDTYIGSDGSPRASTRRLKHYSNNSLSSTSSRTTNSTSSYYSATSEQDFGSPKKENYSMPPRRTLSPLSPVFGTMDYVHNIEMQICLDLLKQDLSSALPPRNPSDSTLALQLWLMIESYEAMKRRLLQQLPRQTTYHTSESTFQVLDHWLEALYSVYNMQLPDRRRSAII